MAIIHTGKKMQFVSYVSVLSARSSVANKRENRTTNLIYIYTHTHTHTHIYIYIYIYTGTSFCNACSQKRK